MAKKKAKRTSTKTIEPKPLVSLTTGETAVMAAVWAASKRGRYYALVEKIRVDGMTDHSIAGTLGALANKGLVRAFNDRLCDIAVTCAGARQCGGTTTACNGCPECF